jgi:hypothetical protein
MNQGQRFDELTRALATTQLSRWQLLKGLIAGAVVAGTFGGWARSAVAATACTKAGVEQCIQQRQAIYDGCYEGCGGEEPRERKICRSACKRSLQMGIKFCRETGCPEGQQCCGGACIGQCDSCSQCDEARGTCKSNCSHPCAECIGFGICELPEALQCKPPRVLDTTQCICKCPADLPPCPTGATRDALTCECNCPTGQTLCNDQCVDLDSDEANCGACGKACTGGTSCVGGSCQCLVSVASVSAPATLQAVSTSPCNGVCCDSCQVCDQDRCRPCNACETCEGGQCAPNPVAQPCGEGCCSSCQVCDDFTTGTCRDCNACETCEGGKCVPLPGQTPCGETCCDPNSPKCEVCDANGSCVTKTCPPRTTLNLNTCECECQTGCNPPLVSILGPDNVCRCMCPPETPNRCGVDSRGIDICCGIGESCCNPPLGFGMCCGVGTRCCNSSECVPVGSVCPPCTPGGSCNAFPHGCNNRRECMCFQTDKGSVCFDERTDHTCATYQRCNTSLDCPTGEPCAINTCCADANGTKFNICIKPAQICSSTANAAPTAKSPTVNGQQPGIGPTASRS